MSNRMRIMLIAGAGLVIVLSVLLFTLSGSPARRPTSLFQPNPTTVPVVKIGDPKVKQQLITIMKEQTPIMTDDVEIVYSPLIEKYYIHKKTGAADPIIRDFFEKNNILSLLYEPGRVVYVNENALYYMLDEERRLFPDHPDTQRLDI